MSQLEYIHLYIFDIFDKTNSQEIIQRLNQFGVAKEEQGSMSIIDTGKKIDVSKKHWQVNDLSEILKQIEKISRESGLPDISVARTSIAKIEFIGIQNDDLPYFTLLMSVTVDKDKINYENLFNEINTLLRSLRLYVEEFQGITRKLFSPKPICPYFVDIGVLTSKEVMQEIFNNSRELLEGESIPFGSSKLDYMIHRSEKLRKIIPLNTILYPFNLLSVIKLYSNTVSFAGHLEQTAFNGLMTPFVITFSQEKLWDQNFPRDMVLTIHARGYNDFSPWGSTGTIVYLVTMYAWLLHLERIFEGMESELKELRNKIRGGLKDEKKTDLEKYVIELNEKGSLLADFLAEVGRLRRSNETPLREFLEGRTSTSVEIPVPPATKGSDFYLWSVIKDSTGSGAYIQSIALKINYLLKKLHTTLEQYNDENENLSDRLNTLVRIQTENTMKKQNKIMIKATIAIIVLAAVTLVVSILGGVALEEIKNITDRQFSIENSYVTKIEPNPVFLTTGVYHSYYTDGIKVVASGNHPINFRIVGASLGYVTELGKCFFVKGSKPVVELSGETDATIKDQTTVIVPSLFGKYEIASPFIMFDNNKGENFAIGSINFNIIVTDALNPIPRNTTIQSDLVVKLPTEMQEKISHCN